ARSTAAGAGAPREHEELNTRSHTEERRRRPLVRLHVEPEQVLIELVGTLRVRDADCEVAQVPDGEQSFLGRRLRGRADVPADARPAAVADILKLNDDAVGIAEIELGGSSRGAARFRAAHPDARSHRAPAQATARAFGTRDA